jgi:hypothetical protein
MALVALKRNNLITMDFNKLEWHDSIINSIIIDRNNPGKNDSIEIDIIWPNSQKNRIVFKDVYWANFNMNFGIVSEESVLRAFSEGKENISVINIYTRWRGLIDNIDLNFYQIELNSTGSTISIVGSKFELSNYTTHS